MSDTEQTEIYPFAAILTIGQLRSQISNGLNNVQKAKERSKKRLDQAKKTVENSVQLLTEGMHSARENHEKVRERADELIEQDRVLNAKKTFLSLLLEGISSENDNSPVTLTIAECKTLADALAGEVHLTIQRPNQHKTLVQTGSNNQHLQNQSDSDDWF